MGFIEKMGVEGLLLTMQCLYGSGAPMRSCLGKTWAVHIVAYEIGAAAIDLLVTCNFSPGFSGLRTLGVTVVW